MSLRCAENSNVSRGFSSIDMMSESHDLRLQFIYICHLLTSLSLFITWFSSSHWGAQATCVAVLNSYRTYVLSRLLIGVSVSHTVLHHLAVPPTQSPWTENVFQCIPFPWIFCFHRTSLSNTEALTCTQQDETSASPVFSRLVLRVYSWPQVPPPAGLLWGASGSRQSSRVVCVSPRCYLSLHHLRAGRRGTADNSCHFMWQNFWTQVNGVVLHCLPF